MRDTNQTAYLLFNSISDKEPNLINHKWATEEPQLPQMNQHKIQNLPEVKYIQSFCSNLKCFHFVIFSLQKRTSVNSIFSKLDI